MKNNIIIIITWLGLIGLFFGIYKTHIFNRRYQVYVVQWKLLLFLLYFFAVGFLVFIFGGKITPPSPEKLFVSVIFCGGGIFVFLTILLIDRTIVKIQSITELEILNKELRNLADRDDLTGIYKRRFFEKALKEALVLSRMGKLFAILFIDLNDFKIINDTYGHLAGDAILLTLTNEFQHTFRSTDVIARLGGDEFAVLLSYDKKYPLADLAKILIDRIDTIELDFDDTKIKVHVSVGVVAITEEYTDIPSIMAAADAACYEAKHKKVKGQSGFFIKVN